MQLFQLRKYQVIFEPQTMMLKPFADIRDKNEDEDLTLKELSFIWFFTDVRSDFQSIIDEDIRKEEIIKAISLPKEWEPDETVIKGIKFYKEYSKTPSSSLYDASVKTVEFIEKELKNPEALLEKTDSRGNPIYKLDSLLTMLNKIPDAMEKLKKAKDQVIREMEEQSQLKGQKVKSMFEDGI
jgi:hypothetical protein